MKRLILLLCSLFVALFMSATSVDAAPPSDFQVTQIIGSGLDGPSGFALAPDGRIFILERTGKIKVYKNGVLLPTPFADLPSIGSGDRGLIGIAFDPDFATNSYVYFYYTGLDKLNRLVRFDASSDVGTNGPVILYQTSFPSELLHVGGSIQFGPDGKLYFAVGDNGYPPNAQKLDNPHGKILRINKDGSIPLDNPFYGDPLVLPEIWAYGFRNPWRFQFDSVTGKLYGGDVGDFSIEEVNRIEKGGNYGWPLVEGFCESVCPYINPLFAYPHAGESAAVTGGPIYRSTMFPESYRGNLFFADYAQGFIKRMILDGDGNSAGVVPFDENAGSVVDMKVAPDGSMYYITYYPGRLYRITYGTDNHVPVASAGSNVTKGTEPLTVHFTSSGSSDPDNDPITYLWNFGDGTSSTDPDPTKIYTTQGAYTVQLTVSDGTNSAQAVPIVIQVGLPPSVTIAAPVDGAKYRAGDEITYNAFAEDGAGFDLNDANIKTEIIFHHDTHIHPFLGPLQGRAGTFTIPSTGEPAANTWYEVMVTATDINGLSATKSVNIFPHTSHYSLTSNIPSLSFFLDGVPITTPKILQGVVGFVREISTKFVQLKEGIVYQFDSWSDGGFITHFITTPAENTTYAATFREVPGFHAEYFDNPTLDGAPVVTRQDPEINFFWSAGTPAPGVPADQFSARWTKRQHFPEGKYQFTVVVDDGMRLKIDGEVVLDKWFNQPPTTYKQTVDLTEGEHDIVVEYFETFGDAVLTVGWEPVEGASSTPTPTGGPTPPPGNGPWTASYFANMALVGSPAVIRNEQAVDFDWRDGTPDPAIPADQFSARFTRDIETEAGNYVFTIAADDGVRLFVDNELVLDKWIDQPETTYTAEKILTAGMHTLKVEYYDNYVDAIVKLSYEKEGTTPSVTPTPPSDGYLGKYWNFQKNGQKEIPARVPELTRTDAAIDFDWKDGTPDTVINPDHFIAQWTRSYVFEDGTYKFTTETDDGIRVFLDGKKILDEWNDHSQTTHTVSVPVTAGQKEVRVEYFENYGDAVAKFSFAKTGSSTTTYKGEYFDNMTLTGNPVLVRDDPAIQFPWREDAPDGAVPANHFSVRWIKKEQFVAGEHTFTLKADDGVRFFIDEQVIVDDWTDHATKTYTPTVTLIEGEHTIKVEYYENYGDAIISLEKE